MADDSQSSSLQLTIRLTTHPVLPVPTNYPLSTTRTATVADLKQQLQREFDGKPLAEGIVCVKGGRVCKDTEVLGELFPAEVSSSVLFGVPIARRKLATRAHSAVAYRLSSSAY